MRPLLIAISLSTTLTCIVVNGPAHAQTDVRFDYLFAGISSPTAAALAKYGDIPVSHFTGTPNINIPLFELKSRSLSLPIALGYHASGIRVEEIPGSAGAGWSLDAGGVITRTVRGLPDDQNSAGYLYAGGDSVHARVPNSMSQGYLEKVNTRLLDGEPDSYFFNFSGRSGQIFFERDESASPYKYKPIVSPRQDIRVEFGTQGWVLRTEDGTRYLFNQAEVTQFDSNDPNNQAVTSWYLSRIESATGDDVIELSYQAGQGAYIPQRSQEASHNYPGGGGDISCLTGYYSTNYSYLSTSKFLSSIETAMYRVDFSYASRSDGGDSRLDTIAIRYKPNSTLIKQYVLIHGYFSAGSRDVDKRLRLDALKHFDGASVEMPPWVFTYDTSYDLPARDSYALDHWGFYNGQIYNTTLIPEYSEYDGYHDTTYVFPGANREPSEEHLKAGMLTEIRYPTGGKSVMVYEGHRYGHSNTLGGGPRIRRIEHHDAMDTSRTIRLNYSYSQGTMLIEPKISHRHSFQIGIGEKCDYISITSASYLAPGMMSGSVVTYPIVTVSNGLNGAAGETVTQFDAPTYSGNIQWPFIPTVVGNWRGGSVSSVIIKNSSGIALKQSLSTYQASQVSTVRGLVVAVRSFQWGGGTYYEFIPNHYAVDAGAWRPISQVNSVFGVDTLTTSVNIEYASAGHVQPTRKTETNSDGTQRVISYVYAHERYPAMADSNKMAQVYSKTITTSAGQKLDSTWTTWSNSVSGNSNWLPNAQRRWAGSTDSITVAEVAAYDPWGNPVKVIDALGTSTRLYYGSNTAPFSQVGLGGVNGVYLTGIIADSAGIDLRTQARYDALGRLDTLIDANGNKTRYTYDSMHRLVGVHNHANEIVSANEYTYVGSGISSSNPNWIRTTNHLTSIATTVATSYFDGLGRPIQTHLREGTNDNVTAMSYDALGRQDKQWSTYLQSNSSHVYRPSFASEAAAYYDSDGPGPNSFGRPYVQTKYEASPLGRPIRTYPQKTSSTLDSVQTSYGVASYGGVLYNLTETIDDSGKKSRTYTDGWGRTIVSTASFGTPDSASTKFEYDLLGRLTKVTSPMGRLTHYRYDNLGRMTAKTTPDADGDLDGNPSDETGISTSVDFEYTYDNAGNLIAMRDPNRKAASQFVFSRYDALGRKTYEGICSSTWPAGCATGGSTSQMIEYTWDDASVGSAVSFTINNAKGRQTKVAFQGGYYLYSYEADGNIERTYIKLDGIAAGKTVAYSYDRQGNLTTRWFELAGGSTEKFEHRFSYDAVGRLDSLRTTGGPTTIIREANYTWWPDGNMKTEKLSTPTNTFTYDARGRLTAINNTGSTATKFSAAYVWNPNSTLQIAEYHQTNPPVDNDKRYRHSFTYDGRNQLRTADYEYHNGSTWADRYDFDIGQIYYDRDGGITLMNRQNGAEVVDFEYGYVAGSNRLDYVLNYENFDIDDISHDRNGNITNGRGISATTYDWRNLPLSITTPNPWPMTGSTTHAYRYDHNGHRVYSSVDSTYTIRGAYGEPIAEYAGITPVIKYWNYVRPDGVVIGRRSGGVRFYYHRDHLGSTRTVLNASSGVVETYDYMPFGEFMSGRITTSGTGTRPKFTGHAFDDETDLHNMQWRRQIPRYGVFRTPDPMADSFPGWNSYAYVMNDPMRYLDPTGLAPCEAGTARVEGITCYQSDEVITVRAWQNDFANSFYGFFYANYAQYGDPGPSVTNDQFMRALDVAGSIDPTGVLDLAAATIYAFQGDFVNASISAASILTAGDLLKASRIATKGAAKGGVKLLNQFNSAESLIQGAGNLSEIGGGSVLQGFVKGDGEAIFRAISQGGTRRDNGTIMMNDGTILTHHRSKTSGDYTIDINRSGQKYKIRITP